MSAAVRDQTQFPVPRADGLAAAGRGELAQDEADLFWRSATARHPRGGSTQHLLATPISAKARIANAAYRRQPLSRSST